MERIDTFTVLYWHGMPKQISPIFCALNGYQCVGPSQIQCDMCGAKLDLRYLQFNTKPEAI